MRDLPEIGAAYALVDAMFDASLDAARRCRDEPGVEQIESRQRINDQAYFVLCWGQLETTINESCRAVIERKQRSSACEDRRGWDIYSLNDRRLSGLVFEERTAFVVDRQASGSGPFSKIMTYYGLRNRIAHGTVLATRIDIPGVIRDLYVLQSQLAT